MARIEPLNAALGKSVRRAIGGAGMTQAVVSDLINMPLNSLSRRINGHIGFTLPELAKIAAVTGTTASDLVLMAEDAA